MLEQGTDPKADCEANPRRVRSSSIAECASGVASDEPIELFQLFQLYVPVLSHGDMNLCRSLPP